MHGEKFYICIKYFIKYASPSSMCADFPMLMQQTRVAEISANKHYDVSIQSDWEKRYISIRSY